MSESVTIIGFELDGTPRLSVTGNDLAPPPLPHRDHEREWWDAVRESNRACVESNRARARARAALAPVQRVTWRYGGGPCYVPPRCGAFAQVRDWVRESLSLKIEKRAAAKPAREPRYDDVFFEGVAWLDGM